MIFKPGDVAFIMHTDDSLSRLLSWFMQSQWSHSLMIVKPSDEYTFTSETSDFEVTVGWLERYTSDPHCRVQVWRARGISDELGIKMASRCMQNYGIVYGYLQLLSFGVGCLLKRIGIKIKNFIRQGLVCDENVLTGLILAPIPGIEGIDPKSIQTQELYERIVASNACDMIYEKKAE